MIKRLTMLRTYALFLNFTKRSKQKLVLKDNNMD